MIYLFYFIFYAHLPLAAKQQWAIGRQMQPGKTFSRDSSRALLWGKDFSCTFVLIQSKLKDVCNKVNLSVHILAQNCWIPLSEREYLKIKLPLKIFIFPPEDTFADGTIACIHMPSRATPSQNGSWPALWQRLTFSPLKWRKCQRQQPLFFPLSGVSYKTPECTMLEWQKFQTRISHFWPTHMVYIFF